MDIARLPQEKYDAIHSFIFSNAFQALMTAVTRQRGAPPSAVLIGLMQFAEEQHDNKILYMVADFLSKDIGLKVVEPEHPATELVRDILTNNATRRRWIAEDWYPRLGQAVLIARRNLTPLLRRDTLGEIAEALQDQNGISVAAGDVVGILQTARALLADAALSLRQRLGLSAEPSNPGNDVILLATIEDLIGEDPSVTQLHEQAGSTLRL